RSVGWCLAPSDRSLAEIFRRGPVSRRRAATMYQGMDHSDVIARLRALGDQAVDPAAAGHVASLAAGAAALRRRVTLVAGSGLLVALASAGVVLAATGGSDDGAATAVNEVPPADEFTCTGPPPFAADPAASTVPVTTVETEAP